MLARVIEEEEASAGTGLEDDVEAETAVRVFQMPQPYDPPLDDNPRAQEVMGAAAAIETTRSSVPDAGAELLRSLDAFQDRSSISCTVS